jgi:hypothetical protein
MKFFDILSLLQYILVLLHRVLYLIVVLADIGDIIAYRHVLHFCQEVYPYRNQNKV